MTDTDIGVAPPESFRAAVWAQFKKHKGAMFGLVVLVLLVIFVVVGPMVWQPEKLKVAEALKSKNLGPSLRFPMGTDQLGRDQLARMMTAGKVSLAVGFVAMMIAVFLGVRPGVTPQSLQAFSLSSGRRRTLVERRIGLVIPRLLCIRRRMLDARGRGSSGAGHLMCPVVPGHRAHDP